MLKNITINGRSFNLGDLAAASDRPLASGWIPVGPITKITNNVIEIRTERDPGYAAAGFKVYTLTIGDFGMINSDSVDKMQTVEMIQKSGLNADEAVRRLINFIESKGMMKDLRNHVETEMMSDVF